MKAITGLSPEKERFLLPLRWYNISGLHPLSHLTRSTPKRTTKQLIAELRQYVNSIGAKKALTYIAVSRLLSKLEFSLNSNEVGIPPKMMEFSIALIGSLPEVNSNSTTSTKSHKQRADEIKSLPDSALSGGYRSRQHRTYGPEMFRIYDTLEKLYSKFSDEYVEYGDAPFQDDESLSMAAQNSELTFGQYAYPEQYIETMERIYAPYQVDFLNNRGLDMIKGVKWASQLIEYAQAKVGSLLRSARFYQADCLRLIGGIHEAIEDGTQLIDYLESPLHIALHRAELESWANLISEAEKRLWLSEETAISKLDSYNQRRIKNFLERISVKSGEYKIESPFGFNQLEATPLLEVDGEFLLTYPQMHARALSKTFFYDLQEMNESRQLVLNFNMRGDLLEHWVHDRVLQSFVDGGQVHRSVKWEKSNEEIDIVAKLGSTAVIIEVKSKFLTNSARKGAVEDIKDDLDKGILGAVNQLDRKISLLKQGKLNFSETDSSIDFNNDTIEEYIPIVVMGADYDRIATMDYASQIDKQTIIPYVISIYDLDILSRFLNTEHFVKYTRERRKIAADGQIHSVDELDYLGFYSKTGPDMYENLPGGRLLGEIAEDSDYHFTAGIEGADKQIRPLIDEYGQNHSVRWLTDSEIP